MVATRAARGGRSTVALLWGNSQLWGTLMWRGLRALGAPVVVLKSQDIARGELQRVAPGALLAPGGWAKQRSHALGPAGRQAIQDYLHDGGVYMGFCGGAGLALQAPAGESLNLCPCDRKPITERLVNCSGHLELEYTSNHPLCPPMPSSTCMAPVWWPSQFELLPDSQLTALAHYRSPGKDFWVADLPYQDIPREHLAAWEEHYGITLDPELLRNEPAVVTGRHGAGHYILSYVHLETPGSGQANRWLGHMLSWATGQALGTHVPEWHPAQAPTQWQDPHLAAFLFALEDCLAFGQRHFLFNWRTPWLLGWRRGLPGFHLSTLYGLAHQIRALPPTPKARRYWQACAAHFQAQSQRFLERTREYLLLERYAATAHTSHSTPIRSACTQAQAVREELLGPFPGQSGICGELTAILENLLYCLIAV